MLSAFPARSLSWLLFTIFLATSLPFEREANADFYEVLLSRRKDRRTSVVFKRQEVDHDRGFDTFYIEVHGYNESQPKRRTRLGKAQRAPLRKLGHHDLYMKTIKEDADKELALLRKDGYEPAVILRPITSVGEREATFLADGKSITLRIEEGKTTDELVLVVGNSTAVLRSFAKDTRRKGDASLARTVRTIQQVALAGKGRVLLVVLRELPIPTDPEKVQDVVFMFHTRRPLKTLGVHYPLQPELPESSKSR